MVATGIKFDWTKRAKRLLYTAVLMLYKFVYSKVSISFIQDVSDAAFNLHQNICDCAKLLLKT